MNVVLVHGWGHDAGIWDAVRAQLAPALAVTTLDFGYFGAVSGEPTFTEPVLAVGHSLGALWWLAQSTIPWRRLLCLDGFPRFTETDGYPGVAPRVLARMQKQLERDPAAVLTDFHARCGTTGTGGPAGTPDATKLAAGLAQLAELDGRATLAARAADVWALAGDGDPIVPAAMSAAAFAALPAGHYECVATPGHRLPQSRPELCAQWIERLASI